LFGGGGGDLKKKSEVENFNAESAAKREKKIGGNGGPLLFGRHQRRLLGGEEKVNCRGLGLCSGDSKGNLWGSEKGRIIFYRGGSCFKKKLFPVSGGHDLR